MSQLSAGAGPEDDDDSVGGVVDRKNFSLFSDWKCDAAQISRSQQLATLLLG